jgi:hypothetical protein
MNNREQVLLESSAARNAQLAEIDSDRAECLLNKAKALHFNVFQGTGIATTEQVAEFYEVPIETVKSAVKYHRSEFDVDGLKVLKGKKLNFVRLKFNLTSNTKALTVWNPRATLRLGYLLTDSVTAKAVRTTSLNFIEQAPQANQAAPPSTIAQMLLVCAQQLVEQEHRLTNVEYRISAIEQCSSDAAKSLSLLPAPSESAPPLNERDSLLKLINVWSVANNVAHQEVWQTLYRDLYIRDGFFSVNVRIKNSKAASKLDLVIEHGKLGVLYAIATEIFAL